MTCTHISRLHVLKRKFQIDFDPLNQSSEIEILNKITGLRINNMFNVAD